MDEETEIDINASKDLWQDTLAIADKYIPQFAAAFLISVAFQIRNIDKTALTNAIASGNANQVNDVLKWDKTFEKLMKLQTKIKACAYESSKNANKKMGYGADPKTSYSFRYIEQYGSKKIKNINDETYNAIQELLKTSFRGDLTTKETANAISKFIGLDSRRFNSLMKYENALVKEGYQPSVIKKMVQDQRNMMLRQRAEVIARTETMAASNYGTIASYKDMVDRGILDKNKYWLAWMVTPDDRLCDKCRTMKNKNANIGSNFFNEAAKNPSYERVFLESPPLHPQCRCTTCLQRKDVNTKPTKPTNEPKPEQTKPTNSNNINIPNLINLPANSTKPNIKLTEDEKYSVENYVSDGFLDINKYLRGQKYNGREANLLPNIERLDNAISKSNVSKCIVYRGFENSDIYSKLGNLNGAIIEDKAFVSTSLKRSVADFYSTGNKNMIMEIVIPENTKALKVGNLATNKNEDEILLPRNSKFKIIESSISATGRGTIKAELI